MTTNNTGNTMNSNNTGNTMNTTFNIDQNNLTSLHSSAVLVDLSIKVFNPKMTDKDASEDLTIRNRADAAAAKVSKDLLAGNKRLAAVTSKASEMRLFNKKWTMAWNDNGVRVLPMAKMLDHKTALGAMEVEYWEAVEDFLNNYDTDIAAAAFALGALFKREDYPSLDEVRSRFGVELMYSPVPASGDFRVDIGNAARDELIEVFEHQFKNRVADAMREPWERLHAALRHLSEKMTASEDGKVKRFFATIITGNHELVDALRAMNVVGDPKLSEATADFERLVSTLDLEGLRKDEVVRKDVKSKVDSLLQKFDW